VKAFFHFLKSKLPIAVILGAFSWSCVIIATRGDRIGDSEKIVIRIGHWQLEGGVRDGINELAREYEKLHPNVRIVQEAIPESTWKQWVSTQLMGGTAPDLLEIGNMESNLVTTFYLRYFLPLTEYVGKPNPYNKGTNLEGVPLIKTFKDGMRRSYIEETQEFMNICLSMVGVRLFYNKDLLMRLTGLDKPPAEYREFLEMCRKIRSQKDATGRPYFPISGSGWHYARWDGAVFLPITYPVLRKIDFNKDGRFAKEEMFYGLATGRVGFDNPAYQAFLEMVRETTEFFPGGYTGLNRDEAIFPFAQQRAVFIPAGVYEIVGLKQQTAGKFEVGIAPFPQPEQSDPKMGGVFEAVPYENQEGGFPVGITRTSKHPEIALDFLLFLVSQKGNEILNRNFGWIPIVEGSSMLPEVAAFEPNLEGVYSALDPTLGGETTIKWQQLFSLYQVNQISKEELIKTFASFYLGTGREDFKEFIRNRYRGMQRDEQVAAGLMAEALASPPSDARKYWIKYRNMVSGRVMELDAQTRRLVREVEAGPQRGMRALDSYSPQALSRIKAKISKPEGSP